jgi:lipopolysaccharide exporter
VRRLSAPDRRPPRHRERALTDGTLIGHEVYSRRPPDNVSNEPEDATDIRTAALRGLRWIVIARPAVEIMLLGSMVALARLIPPAEFGHFAIATLISGLGVVSAASISTALVQRPELEREHLQAGFAIALLAGAALFGLTLLAAKFLVVPVFGARTAYLVRLSAPGSLIAAAGAAPQATLQRELAFRRLSLIDVVGSGLRAFGSVGLALAGLNGTALVVGVLAGITVGTVLACIWAPPPLPRLRLRPVRDVLNYGLPAWMASVSWIGFQNCDYAIVGARLGAVQAGYYFRAYTLGVEYQKKVSQVMASVGFPVLARTKSPAEMGELRSRMVRLLTLLLFPLLALLVVTAPVAVPWVFGHAWAPAVAPTQVLAVGGAATLVIDAVGAAMMAAGRARALLGFGWAHFATYALAVFITAPFGLTAVAASAAVVHTAFVFVAYVLMLQGTQERAGPRLWADVAPAIISSLVLLAASVPVSIAMSAAHAPVPLNLAAVALTAAGAYTLTLRTGFNPAWTNIVSFLGHLLPHRRTESPRGKISVELRPVSAPTET